MENQQVAERQTVVGRFDAFEKIGNRDHGVVLRHCLKDMAQVWREIPTCAILVAQVVGLAPSCGAKGGISLYFGACRDKCG